MGLLSTYVRAAAWSAAVAAALVATHAQAQQDHTWHPLFNVRMAVSDRSTASAFQPWIWAATAGDGTSGPLLSAKQADNSSTSAWTLTFALGLTSGPDAISWTSGSTAHQRIFYSRNNQIQMLDWDNSTQNSFTDIPAPANITLPVGDVAALTFGSGSSRRMVVASYAAKSGANGFLCFWEKLVSSSGSFTSSCTATAVMTSVNDPLPDIVGVVQSGTPLFFFRNNAGHLGRARRTGTATFTIEQVSTFAIGPSVFATPSQASGSVDVGMIRSDNGIRIHRFNSPTALTPSVSIGLPALPGGATPAVTSNVAISGGSYPISATGSRTQVAVYDTAFRLYTIRSTNNTGTVYDAAWTGPVVPGRVTTTAPEQVVTALGPLIGNTAGNAGRLFFVAAGAIGFDYATSLGEYMWGFPRPFSDHGRFNFTTEGLDDTVSGATESSAGVGPVKGIATAIQRNNPPPWKITSAGTDDNATSFGNSATLVPATPTFTQSDPVAAHGGFGGHLIHFAAIEMATPTGGGDTSECSVSNSNDRVVYRRGFASQDIVNSVFVTVGPGTPGIGLDHPGIGVTVDSSDQPTAHVAYWDKNLGVRYWFLSPGDVVNGPFTIPTGSLPSLPAGISVGNNQGTVYAWVFSAFGNGWPTICRMKGSDVTGLVCGKPPTTGAFAKMPTSKVISYGAHLASNQVGSCPPLPNPQGGQPRFSKCFDNAQPAAIFADPTQNNRLHIAYQAPSFANATRLSIWYTRNTDSNLAMWTPPVEIATDSTRDLVNPAITIDYDGQIVVTYSRILNATFSTPTDGRADTLVAWSTVDSSTWHSNGQVVSSWDADNLPFHCGPFRTKWFLGEYRYGDVVAGRAVHLLNESNGSPSGKLRQRAMWFSRQLNLD
jgi:hypothetical protein